MARLGDVGHTGFVMRSEDASHPRVLRAPGLRNRLRDVAPTAAGVPGHLSLAIVRADPNYAGLRGRFGDRGDRAMLNGRARRTDLRGIVGRQIRADLLPRIAAI